MNTAERTTANADAILSPAPNLPGLSLRPFNDGTLGLCAQIGLTMFTLEALSEAEAKGGLAKSLGLTEVSRQCQTLFFILGYGRKMLPAADHEDFAKVAAEQDAAEPAAIVEMTRMVQEKEAFSKHVLPWLLRQKYDGSLVPRMLGEWTRFMKHFLAASVELLPGSDSGPGSPN